MLNTSIIDRDNPQKLYMQLYEIMKRTIESGQWAVETRIPTEDELCRLFDVSKATVRLAVAELARKGYLKRQQGKGTFVCKRVITEGLSMVTSFRELMLEAGVTFRTKLLARTVMTPTDDLELKLDMPEDRHVIYIKRLRYVGDEPLLIQETYIPHSLCARLLDENLEESSLQDVLQQKCGLPITKVRDYISITHLTPKEAELLRLKPDASVLQLDQLLYCGDTQISYTRSLKHPDRFSFYIELDRTQR